MMVDAMNDTTVRVSLDGAGRPRAASAEARIEQPPDRVWAVVADVNAYAERIPMIHRTRLDGDRVTVDLRFKVSLLSVGFQFVAAVAQEPGRWLELRGISGEPRGIRLRFELSPVDDGRACALRSDGEFDVHSLGWLAKYFLRHHPEIEYGIFPGVALALLESMRRAAAGSAPI
jgi:ribosome-associated toxin RatA of RatAB toxin-antitoxin module